MTPTIESPEYPGRFILAKSHYYETAGEFLQLVANAGDGPKDSRLVVMTGGGHRRCQRQVL